MAENSDTTEGVGDVGGEELVAKLEGLIGELELLRVGLAERGIDLAQGESFAAVILDFINGQALLLNEAQEQLTSLKADAAKAKRAPAAKASAAPKVRKIKPITLKDGDMPLTPAELKALIDDAEAVEVAFSDGKQEIAGLPAQDISGDAWHVGVAGLQLRLPELIVHGPGVGQPGYSLAGYGLIIDGDLVAYSDRGGVLTIAPGATVNLASDVVFRG